MLCTPSPDFFQLCALHARCFEHGWSAEELESLFQVAGTFAFIDPQQKGFAILRHIAGEAEIITFGVVPGSRRQGTGNALLGHILEFARKLEAESLFLEVRESNEAAMRLYQKAGFSVISRRKDYYRTPDNGYENAIIMRKAIF